MNLSTLVTITITKFIVWMQKPNATFHLEAQKNF